jgi:hypothetical protein
MQPYLNYEDSIFILNIYVRALSDLLMLEADSGLFLNKTLEDIQFVGRTCEAIMASLLENKNKIDWTTQINNLIDLELDFTAVLRRMVDGSARFSVSEYPSIAGIITQALKESEARRHLLTEGAHAVEKVAVNDPHVVSTEEISLLLG